MTEQATPVQAAAPEIEQGAYEVLRGRLLEGAKDLRARGEALNAKRLALFGGEDMGVAGNERVRTEDNCVPRDIVSVGDRLLFGYNVFHGLKETEVKDVLSLQAFTKTETGFSFEAVDPAGTFLGQDKFLRDFKELYKYYKGVQLVQLRELPGRLLLIFRIGQGANDLKVLRFTQEVDGRVEYIDNRGERDFTNPPSHDFEWIATNRDHYVTGKHPHVNVLGEVFVETVGGDLTVKIENNTESGLGIYSEPVEDANQSLADGQIHYARVGNLILLKILPYKEKQHRYLIFNTRTKDVHRVDAIGQACVSLPEDHGIIFPGGYYLQEGALKKFDGDFAGMGFMESVKSPNGEDVLYVFRNPDNGRNALLAYNLIRKEVRPPLRCNGYCLFDDGMMVVFQATSDEPTRVHPMQVWKTPFTSREHEAASRGSGSFLENVGNAELVRGVSDCLGIARRIEEQKPSLGVFEDLVAAVGRSLDHHHWLSHDEAGGLHACLAEIRKTATLVLEEFDKVQTLRRQATESVGKASQELGDLVRKLHPDDWKSIDPFVETLGKLRTQRGHVITLKDMRYADLPKLEELEAEAVRQFDGISQRAVGFLLGEGSLTPYLERIDAVEAQVAGFAKVADVDPSLQELTAVGGALELLTEVLGTLKIQDATERTRILENISEVMARLNRARALVTNKRQELGQSEAVAEFGVQFQLFGQSVASAIQLADTPEKCDDALSRLMLQLEELDGRFGEFEDFMGRLVEKREDVYKSITSKKQTLVEQRQRRVQQLLAAADRVLEGVQRRAATLTTNDELNAYFASDSMVMKVRDLCERLRELGDPVKADELEARLKSARQDSGRTLRDKKDMFEEGASVVRLGRHRFSINTEPVELTVVPRDGKMHLHLTGTDFFERIEDEALERTRDFWDQELVSETPEVYRSEYLAACLLADAEAGRGGLSLSRLREVLLSGGERAESDVHPELLALVRTYAQSRYDEGYDRGVHDVDAADILETLLGLYGSLGLLRFSPHVRAAACLFWAQAARGQQAEAWVHQARSLHLLESVFGPSDASMKMAVELSEAIGPFLESSGWAMHGEDLLLAGEYLVEELGDGDRFVTSGDAVAVRDAFLADLDARGNRATFLAHLQGMKAEPARQLALVRAWLGAFLAANPSRSQYVLDEAAVLILTEGRMEREISSGVTSAVVRDLLGQHPRIAERSLEIRLDEFLGRLSRFRRHRVPAYREYQKLRHGILERERHRMRLDEVTAKIMSAFVRNKLIDEVYLPLVGDNLAKQMGSVGAERRTDQMGMLLLISPPGYGKTTLMEYVASRLGLIFVKVNGPALGHAVTSLDPAEAPNATAKQEVEKVNFALEMGNNVMLYLDDIQHTNSEFLQKFISLCDAQRKVEGVWKGRTRTYDLKGKRFCICMAGNPYTETGTRFQIPDMLANRADTYNLGDVLAGKEHLFELSYIENSLTSNKSLAPLAAREPEDLYKLVRMAEGVEIPASELAHGYSPVELEEVLSVLRKLLKVQKVLLRVNKQYILSAAMDERDRTEPPFKLQGSYRNMNKLTEKVVPVMNDDELEHLIDDHYTGEAQTLTTGAEVNLLKLAELRGRQTPQQAQRWEEIRRGFTRRQVAGGDEADPVNRVTQVLARLSQGVSDIGAAVSGAPRVDVELAALREAVAALGSPVSSELAELRKALAAPSPLAPELAALRGAVEALASASPVAPELAGVRAAVEALAARPAEDFGPVLEALAAQPAAAPDLGPVLEGLTQVLASQPSSAPPVMVAEGASSAEVAEMVRAMASRPAAAAAPDLTPFLEELTRAISLLAERPVAFAAEGAPPPVRTVPYEAPTPRGPASAATEAAMLASMDHVVQLVPRLRELARTIRGPKSKAIVMDPALIDVFDGLKDANDLTEVVAALGRLGKGKRKSD